MSLITRAALLALPLALAACHHNNNNFGDENVKPDYIKGTIVSATYDGTTNDLLTAGLGKTGLAGTAPVVAVATAPTVAELRTLAIYNNYRALLDMTANGGYGVLYGPNIDVNGGNTLGEGKIAGEEHLAFADDGTGAQNVTLMVQIPGSFDIENPCIITATSSGSRGVYGAIGTAGDWGLKHKCAVAYTDKGTGNGGHDLVANTVTNLQGTRAPVATAGTGSIFTANLSATDLAAFNAAFPNRWAYKHAHSQQTPEATWGRDTLRAIVQGLWWRGFSESGWGINLTQQGDTLFATWFTYDADGSGMWLVMPNGARSAEGAYSGTLYRTTGPAYSAAFGSAPVVTTPVGNATFSFNGADSGTFTATVNGVTVTKPIIRQVYASPVPVCTLGAAAGAVPNYQDLWWRSSGAESGWGINITHQGEILFLTWFTYDIGGKGLWLVASNVARTGNATYSGTLYRTWGAPFNMQPWSPSTVRAMPVGTVTLTFTDASNGTFTATVEGSTVTKPITREVFASPSSVCRQ